MNAIKEYETNKWKVIGQKVGKPAKVCSCTLDVRYEILTCDILGLRAIRQGALWEQGIMETVSDVQLDDIYLQLAFVYSRTVQRHHPHPAISSMWPSTLLWEYSFLISFFFLYTTTPPSHVGIWRRNEH